MVESWEGLLRRSSHTHKLWMFGQCAETYWNYTCQYVFVVLLEKRVALRPNTSQPMCKAHPVPRWNSTQSLPAMPSSKAGQHVAPASIRCSRSTFAGSATHYMGIWMSFGLESLQCWNNAAITLMAIYLMVQVPCASDWVEKQCPASLQNRA